MKKLRNCIILLFCMMINSSIVFAKTGDIIGKILSTDITAYINGAAIPSYNIDGYTGIVAEDLENYGFDVTYNDKYRQLRIENNFIKEFTANYVPEKNPKPVGTFLSNVYDTDIIVYLSKQLSHTYNIDGKTIILIDDLKEYGNVTWYPEERKVCFYSNDIYLYPDYDGDTTKEISNFQLEFKRKEAANFKTAGLEIVKEENQSYLDSLQISCFKDKEDKLYFSFSFSIYQRVINETSDLRKLLDKMLNQDREGNKVQEGTDFVNEHIKVSVNGITIPVTFVRGGGGNGHSDYYFYFDTSSINKTVKNFGDIQTIIIECK
ncbi:MAG: hypothetical protein HFE57_08965 [Firmicutes bacterium]|jgi:hypothetical protein|nr:hypothetical protein [Bacillota bacterium]